MRGTGFQFRVKHLLILTTVVAAGILLLTPRQAVYWIGGFDLKVTLVGEPDAPIQSIDSYPLENDFVLEGFKADELEGGGSPERVTLSADNSFHVYLTTTGKTTSTGRDLSYHQPKYLGVVLTLDDGTSQRFWVELPDGRENKEVELKIGLP